MYSIKLIIKMDSTYIKQKDVIEKQFFTALIETPNDKRYIYFLFNMIKNRMSDNLKINILIHFIEYYYITIGYSNFIGIYKKIYNITSNECKQAILCIIYDKETYNGLLEPLIILLDCNIYSLSHNDITLLILCAAKRNDINTLEYLFTNLNDKINVDHLIEEFNNMCKFGYLIAIQWYVNKFEIITKDMKNIVDGFHYACINGNSEVIKWFLTNFKTINDSDKSKGLYLLCSNNYLDEAEILEDYIKFLSIKKRISIIEKLIEDKEHTYLNNLEIDWIKMLLNVKHKDNTINLLGYVCLHYNLKIIKVVKLYFYGDQKGDLILLDLFKKFLSKKSNIQSGKYHKCRRVDNNCLHLSCRLYKTIKWLIYESNINIDFQCIINFDKILPRIILFEIFNLKKNDVILYEGIIYSNLTQIKDAISKGANYKFLNDFPFFKSCQNYNSNKNEIDIIKYLCSIDPEYYFELISGDPNISYGRYETLNIFNGELF